MTDTYEEWWTQRSAMVEALHRGGHVLITGLGLGVVIASILRTPGTRVESITVVESSAEVLELVAPQLLGRYGSRLRIEHADAFEWRPPACEHYSVVWHDIWPNPYDPANLLDMRRLERRYSSYCDWQGSWGRDLIQEEGRATAS